MHVRLEAWTALAEEARRVRALHLRDLLRDPKRARALRFEHDGVLLDASRQLATLETWRKLQALARQAGLKRRIRALFAGRKVNVTEGRAALHMALRADGSRRFEVDGVDVVPEVLAVKRRIYRFAREVRSGRRRGATGKPLDQVVSIGIGGSYLGPEFVAEALRFEPTCRRRAEGRTLRFLANVDPVDVARALDGLDPERTLAVVVSKSFTTPETMRNARIVRQWLADALGSDALARHMVAVSSHLDRVAAFGLDPSAAFGFWDWVGGRYSVCSAVGLVPLSLQYGPPVLERFLAGARSFDEHFLSAPLARNLPVVLGLFGVWNSTFLGYPARALLPYAQALWRFPAHVQQLDMESNGKRVDLEGRPLPHDAGEIDFGEPGTNGQHSFYQLLHQGRVVPADFIGFLRSQQPLTARGERTTSHDELFAHFLAQPDALAAGRTRDELREEGVPDELLPHKEFPGNRPSNVLLFERLDPYATGQLLALYEHRTVVQGFLWDINSFDQMGVELGKQLARDHLARIEEARRSGRVDGKGLVPSTRLLLERYAAALGRPRRAVGRRSR